MIFSTRHLENNVLFDFNNISLSPVHMHKHLGVIFSNDCKWTKHIDVLIERTSKQLNILRKLKYRLKRDYLEKIYLVFIRPILEYASEVWDNCGQANCNRLEKIQIEAGRIVTGLSIYASFDSIYKETGWETLSTRRKVKKLFLFTKLSIKKHQIIYMNQFRLQWQQTLIIIYVTVAIYMYLLIVCLFTKILTFHVLFKHGILWI